MDFLWASVEEIVPGGGGKEPIFAERELRVDPGRCAWHNNNLDLRMQTLPAWHGAETTAYVWFFRCQIIFLGQGVLM